MGKWQYTVIVEAEHVDDLKEALDDYSAKYEVDIELEVLEIVPLEF